MAHPKVEELEITFRMNSDYIDEDILEIIELLDGKYVVKGKGYPTLVAQIYGFSISLVAGLSGCETA